MLPFALALGLIGSPALAAITASATLEVSETLALDVGYAIGVSCDNPELVDARMTTDRARDTNVLVVTGKQVGHTTCRAGLDPALTSYVFELVVTPPDPAPRPSSSVGSPDRRTFAFSVADRRHRLRQLAQRTSGQAASLGFTL